jgi:biopolymer transport protein ExbD
VAYKRRKDPVLDVELPITPMLDLAFQVLLFFILTYHPSQLEGQLELVLPDAAEGKAAAPVEQSPSMDEKDPELPAEITVVVKTHHDGENIGAISQITVESPQGSRDVEGLEDLRKYLQKLRPGLTNQNDIKLQGESSLKTAHLIEIMDECIRAGFKNVSFGRPPDAATST